MEKCGEAAFSNAVKRRFQVMGKLRLASLGRKKLDGVSCRRSEAPSCLTRAMCSGGSRFRLAVLLGTAMAVSHEVAEGCVAGICTAISPLSRASPHRRRSSPLQNRPASYQSGCRPSGSRPMAW
jgi:hypothetical protein